MQRTRINCVRISSVGRKKFDSRAGGRLGSIPGADEYPKELEKLIRLINNDIQVQYQSLDFYRARSNRKS